MDDAGIISAEKNAKNRLKVAMIELKARISLGDRPGGGTQYKRTTGMCSSFRVSFSHLSKSFRPQFFTHIYPLGPIFQTEHLSLWPIIYIVLSLWPRILKKIKNTKISTYTIANIVIFNVESCQNWHCVHWYLHFEVCPPLFRTFYSTYLFCPYF